MQRLQPDAYSRVRPLVPPASEAGHMAFVHAVLDGAMGGPVFVDDVAAPRTALVCSDSDFWFVLGEPRQDLLAAMVPELIAHHLTGETALWCTSPGWEAALGPLFGEQVRRKEFHYRPGEALVREVELPPGYELRPIDAELAPRYIPALDPWVFRIFGGPDRFLERSFGWAVVHEGEPIASCAACAIGGPPGGSVEAEIEIGTAETYRRRDLATAAALRFMAECRERGLVPAWTCAAGNEPSAKLARRLGFIEFREVAGFELRANMRRLGGRWHPPV